MKTLEVDRSRETSSDHDTEPERRERDHHVARKIARKASNAATHEVTAPDETATAGWSFGDAINAGIHPLVERAAESPGHALPGGLRAKFEASLGTDLGDVRVHSDAAAADASAALGARAYAVGQDVFVGAGQYAPETTEGARLLAHEVAHTVQQRGASAAPQMKLEVSEEGDACELEADAAAFAMIEGRATSVTAATGLARKIMPDRGKPDHNTRPARDIKLNVIEYSQVAAGKIRIILQGGAKKGIIAGLNGETMSGGKPTGRKFVTMKVTDDECQGIVDGSLDEANAWDIAVIHKPEISAGPSADDRD